MKQTTEAPKPGPPPGYQPPGIGTRPRIPSHRVRVRDRTEKIRRVINAEPTRADLLRNIFGEPPDGDQPRKRTFIEKYGPPGATLETMTDQELFNHATDAGEDDVLGDKVEKSCKTTE